MKMVFKQLSCSLFAYIVFFSSSVNAAPITFKIEYSGASFGNTASATGSITFDDTLLPNPGDIFPILPDPVLLALTLNVTGADIGNGVFGITDFQLFNWDTGGGTLDLSTELVGQATNQDPWGTGGGSGGEFNLFSANSLAPEATNYFELTTFNGSGDRMLLTSMMAVPVLPAVWLFGSGLLGLVGIARRKRTA